MKSKKWIRIWVSTKTSLCLICSIQMMINWFKTHLSICNSNHPSSHLLTSCRQIRVSLTLIKSIKWEWWILLAWSVLLIRPHVSGDELNLQASDSFLDIYVLQHFVFAKRKNRFWVGVSMMIRVVFFLLISFLSTWVFVTGLIPSFLLLSHYRSRRRHDKALTSNCDNGESEGARMYPVHRCTSEWNVTLTWAHRPSMRY